MPKSIKFTKDTYLDSAGIVHRQELLSDLLEKKKIKQIDFGYLPNNGDKRAKHDLDLTKIEITKLYGIAQNSNGSIIPLPYATGYNLSYNVNLEIGNSNIYIYCPRDMSSYQATIYIEYNLK